MATDTAQEVLGRPLNHVGINTYELIDYAYNASHIFLACVCTYWRSAPCPVHPENSPDEVMSHSGWVHAPQGRVGFNSGGTDKWTHYSSTKRKRNRETYKGNKYGGTIRTGIFSKNSVGVYC